MRPANPFLLLVLLGPAVATHWGWLPALLATILALALGYAVRRAYALPSAPPKPGPILLIAQSVALFPVAAVAALVLGNTVVENFTPVKQYSGPIAPWMFPVAAIILAAIASLVPERLVARPLARFAAVLTIIVLLACAIGLPFAALSGVVHPVFDKAGAQTGTERFTLQLAAPMLVWQPDGVPPLFPTILLVVASGALASLPWSHRRGAAKVVSPRRSTLVEASVATLALVACASGITMGVNREVGQFGSTGYAPPDYSVISGGALKFNEPDGTYAVLSEYRSQDISKSGWNGAVHPLAEHRIALYHADIPGLSVGWGTRDTDEYLRTRSDVMRGKADPSALDRFTTLSSQVGVLSLSERRNGRHMGVDSSILSDYENDAIRQTLRLPSGTIRFDRTGRIATLTGALPHQVFFHHFREAESLPSVIDAVVQGAANFLRTFGVPGPIARSFAATLVIVLAFLLLEFALRAQRAVIRALACVFVPSTTGPACASCGYDIRGLPDMATPRCPECGETEHFHTAHDRIALPRNASPFNPARWIAWPPIAMTLAMLPLPFIVLTPGWGWTMQFAGWQTKVTLADIALWFPMIAALNIALGTGLLLVARWSRSVLAMIVGASTATLTLAALIWLGILVRQHPSAYFIRWAGAEYAPSILAGFAAVFALVALTGAIHLMLTRTHDTGDAATQTDG